VGHTAGVAVRVAGHLRAQPDEKITLAWDSSRQHFFDAEGKVLNRTPSTF
jgi:sn-glycerol 3-phosphate transport system ATP-binding protein